MENLLAAFLLTIIIIVAISAVAQKSIRQLPYAFDTVTNNL